MSYDFWYDYQREVLVFEFPKDNIQIIYYLNRQFKVKPRHCQIWVQVRTSKESYRMRSYAFQFFQSNFRRIKCNKAKAEAKGIIHHLKTETEKPRPMRSLLAEYEQEHREDSESFEAED